MTSTSSMRKFYQCGTLTPVHGVNSSDGHRHTGTAVGFESEEIEYKLEIASQFAAARSAVLNGSEDWPDLLGAGLASRQGHPLSWRAADSFRSWVRDRPDDTRRALQAIWAPDEPDVAERMGSFCQSLPGSVSRGTGTRATLASVLLMGQDAELYPPFQTTVFDAAYDFTEYDRPDQAADEVVVYEHALGFLDRFIDEAEQRGLRIDHRLEAQSLVWAFIRVGDGADCPDLEALARELYLENSSSLRKVKSLLEKKKQFIFQGPPGTGKTHVAKQLAKHLAGEDGTVTKVQFHASYSYEDFVQGIRPRTTSDGQITFTVRNGPLLQAAAAARAAPTAKHFLVIDEINRGILPRILGELYYLLEYREEGMRLLYQDEDEEDFSLPVNLYIIGTMNTADQIDCPGGPRT